MFERYTEKARRVVFFARYEATQYGSPNIETEHLLLGLLREDKALTTRFLGNLGSIESIRKQIEARITIHERISSTVEIPLSRECKRILNYAAEEAEQLNHKHISTTHILLGMLREEKCSAAEILQGHGLRLTAVREEIARTGEDVAVKRPKQTSLLAEFSRDLTGAIPEGQPDPAAGREEELEEVIEVLCSLTNRNPVLIGERGTGTTAIVEGLAQRIAEGNVPLFLSDKRILLLDLLRIVAGTKYRGQYEERLKSILKELREIQTAIIFIDDLNTLGAAEDSPDPVNILKVALSRSEIQCISTCSPSDYQKLTQTCPWLRNCFQTIRLLPLDAEKAFLVLQTRKHEYEKFHNVVYTDDALRCAVQSAIRFFPRSTLPGKAIGLLDAAGSRVKLRKAVQPKEVVEVMKRIKLMDRRLEDAIAKHEFQKARSLSAEERKEKEALRALREKYHLDEPKEGIVQREDIEYVASRWSGVPIKSMREERAAKESGPAEHAIKLPSSLGAQSQPALRIFLCHSSKDKPVVRDLYWRLKEKRIAPWLDEENLLPGQEWDYEIGNAVRSSHVVIVCLSAHSVTEAGYLHREIMKVLDVADEQPEGTIYVIPLKLEECEVPSRLRRWHWVNFFEAKGFEKLMHALHERARTLGLTL